MNENLEAAGEALDDQVNETAESLDRSTAERLALVRYLFSVAEQQARLPEPVRGIAVLALHDAADGFPPRSAHYAR